MELNSIDDVKALTEYQKIDQIQRIEKKIHKLSFVPISLCAILMSWAFWGMWFGQTSWSPMYFAIIAVTIGSVGYSNVQRTDLLKKLFELKYGG